MEPTSVKGMFGLLKRGSDSKPLDSKGTGGDSVFFSTAFAEQGVDPSMLVPWEARAVEIDAKQLNPKRGVTLLQALWKKDKYMALLEEESIQKLARYFQFATVAADRDIIRQDEYGNFMIVLLTGSIAVDRVQPWGEQLRLTEARPGDILGEMSLLDSGMRFSLCASLSECEIAVLSAEGMDDMMTHDPQLAASLIALLARKLSLRLRVVSARLSDRKA